jgi:hypothetical protein
MAKLAAYEESCLAITEASFMKLQSVALKCYVFGSFEAWILKK